MCEDSPEGLLPDHPYQPIETGFRRRAVRRRSRRVGHNEHIFSGLRRGVGRTGAVDEFHFGRVAKISGRDGEIQVRIRRRKDGRGIIGKRATAHGHVKRRRREIGVKKRSRRRIKILRYIGELFGGKVARHDAATIDEGDVRWETFHSAAFAVSERQIDGERENKQGYKGRHLLIRERRIQPMSYRTPNEAYNIATHVI